MKSDIYKKFTTGERFKSGHYLRVGPENDLRLYIGRDDDGRYSFEFRGTFRPSRINQSGVVSVSQTKSGDTLCLRFSLDNASLLEYFCIFCQDLLGNTEFASDDQTAYGVLCSRYLAWCKLFKSRRRILSEFEVMGLIGEIMFLKEMINNHGVDKSLESWTGPEKTHKDFSLESIWYEIKTVSSGKESVHISSLEQLDSDANGYLIVYELEKMSPAYKGLKLNDLVSGILSYLDTNARRDKFLEKLDLCGYEIVADYDNYVYKLTGTTTYLVGADFPRLTKREIPKSINKIQYDIILAELEKYKSDLVF